MQFDEKFLYHIWDAQHLVSDLKTISGKTIEVIFPGRFNTDSGPDFKNAVFELDNKKVKGDVEIEKRAYNWKTHHHDENIQFNNVILHVVYENDNRKDYTINEKGENIEILEIKESLDTEISKLLRRYSNKKYSGKDKKCLLLSKLDVQNTQKLLFELGLERFEKKVKRFKAEHYFVDFDQLIYQGIMEALGYSKNKFQMLKFSNDFPYSYYKNRYEAGISKEDFLVSLIVDSKLEEHLPTSIPKNFKSKLFKLRARSDNIKEKDNWKLFRIRPANHPVNRLLQLSEFLYISLETSIFHSILQLFSIPKSNFKLSNFKRNLHALFRQRSDVIPQKYLLGKTRIDTILINIILPLVKLYADEKKYSDLKAIIKKIYKEYPRLAENYISKYMKKFMNNEQKKSIRKKEILQQGLIKLYFDFCQDHLCEGCVSRNAF